MAAAAQCAVVIFGASGDLSQLKLVPAIYELLREGLLADKFVLVGYARSSTKKDGTPLNDENYRKDCYEAIKKNARHKPLDEAVWKKMEHNIFYVSGGVRQRRRPRQLAATLPRLDKTHDTGGNRLFYISTPPDAFDGIISRLGERQKMQGPDKPAGWQRLIIEKPFGRDLASAKHLNDVAPRVFRGKAGLPHRPLPRQGDRAEPDGDAVCQLHLRADLELQVHRPRADHGERDAERRRPRRVLRQAAARCAT